MTDKTINYTPEMESRLREVYDITESPDNRDKQIDSLSMELNRTRRSVIAKLSRMGIYIKKEYTTKNNTKPVSKSTIVSGIAKLCDVPEESIESLEKATKKALSIVYIAVHDAKNHDNVEIA